MAERLEAFHSLWGTPKSPRARNYRVISVLGNSIRLTAAKDGQEMNFSVGQNLRIQTPPAERAVD